MSDSASDIAKAQGEAIAGYGNLGTAIAGLIINSKQNKRNLAEQQRVNSAQIAMAERAYKTSLPTTQVGNMRAAGMSQAGAINALNGGGSYTPAPIQAGKEQMLDFSGVQDALANIAQMKLTERMQDKQLKEQKRQFNVTADLERDKLQLDKDKLQETANQNAALRNVMQDDAEYKKAETRLSTLQYEIQSAIKDETISAQKAEYIARQSRAVLENLNSNMQKVGYENMSAETISTLMELRAQLEIVGNVGEMSAAKVIELFHNIKNLVANWL